MAHGPILLSAADCQRLLAPADVVDEVERALAWDAAGTIQWPTPKSLNIAPDRWGNDYHVKACVLEDVPVAGIRLVSHPLDEASPICTRLIVLIDPATTLPLAFVDESWNYAQRTVASIALAARHLAVPGASKLAIIGAGRLAGIGGRTFASQFDLREIRVFARRAERREAFAAELRAELGIDVRAADSAEAAVANVDLVLTATSAAMPVLEDRWIGPGTVVACVGTGEPGAALAEHSDLFVVDSREQLQKELIELFGEAAPGWVDATVGEIVSGKHPGRQDAAQRVLLVTEGIASQDIALAHLAYRRALERGVGLPLPFGPAASGTERAGVGVGTEAG
ncbi:MAG TPA: ornithine cyclodeaminase family protein [Candidatus Limnocylindrales bacterium]|jgi:ornithine cyclodeaminase/alanine dehydrogenase-like protein (mu-crystallin family)|nr:ornithine cyclodeaminase family protein [Candidatus Limnocylindrales bacterium]